jgi:hypothetical protein
MGLGKKNWKNRGKLNNIGGFPNPPNFPHNFALALALTNLTSLLFCLTQQT